MAKNKYEIYTDGSCSKYGVEPVVGGWAAIIICTNSDKRKVIGGCEVNSTNQRMEIMSIIKSLEYCIKNKEKMGLNDEEGYSIKIYSDSAYCVNCINQRWIPKWKMNGWKTSKMTDVMNRDLWEQVYALEKQIDFQIIKVKGHDGIEMNELVDKEAKAQVEKCLESMNKQ